MNHLDTIYKIDLRKKQSSRLRFYIFPRLNSSTLLIKAIFVRVLVLLIIASLSYNLYTIFVSTTSAAFNAQINYQGKLTNASNVAVPDSTYNFRFTLCTASDCAGVGDPIWTEIWCFTSDGVNCDGGPGDDRRVSLTSGLFSVLLGTYNTNLSSIDFNQTLYLQVEAGGSGATPSWQTLTPRKKLGAIPAAFEAGNAATITIADEAADTTSFPLFVTAATGNLAGKTNAGLIFNASTAQLQSTLVSAATGFVPDANDGAYLGTTALQFSDLFLAEGGVINWDNGDATLTQAGDVVTLAGADLALGAQSLTMTGSLAATGARVTKGWFTDLEVTNAIAGSITGNAATITIADEAADTTSFPLFVTAATGNLAGKTNAGLIFNASTAQLQSTLVSAATGFVPDANDGAYLGTTALQFSDLFLAEGGVINWDNGDATLTQAGDVVTLAGANIDFNTNLALNIGNAGTDFTATGGLNLAENLNMEGHLAVGSGASVFTSKVVKLKETLSPTSCTTEAGAPWCSGLDLDTTFTPAAAVSAAMGIGISNQVTYSSTPDELDQLFGIYNIVQTAAGSNQLSAVYGIELSKSFNVAPADSYGIHIQDFGTAGTTNSYALYIDSQTASTNLWDIIHAGTSPNIGIGDTGTLTWKDTANPSHTLMSLADAGTTGNLTVSGTINGLTITGTWQGTAVGVQYGGTGANLSATGGANQFVKQSGAGAVFTVGTIADADVPDTITVSNYLPLAGGTMAGNIDLNTNLLLNIGNAGTDFGASGELTLAGNLDVNGTTNDIAGTLNLSGNSLTASGDLTINPTGGDTNITGTLDVSGHGAFGASGAIDSLKIIDIDETFSVNDLTSYGINIDQTYNVQENSVTRYGINVNQIINGLYGVGTIYGVNVELSMLSSIGGGGNNYSAVRATEVGPGTDSINIVNLFHAANPSGRMSNLRGIYIEDLTPGGIQTTYPIYQAGTTGYNVLKAHTFIGANVTPAAGSVLNINEYLASAGTGLYVQVSATGTAGTYYGIDAIAMASGDAAEDPKTIRARWGIMFNSVAPANAWGIHVDTPYNFLGTAPTTAYGIQISNQGIAGTTDVYGLYIADQTNATNKYPIYQTGTTGTNILNANTRIGSTTAPTTNLDVTGSGIISNSLRVGSAVAPTVALDVTGSGIIGTSLRVGSTSAPTVALDVTGSVTFSGSLTGSSGANTYALTSTTATGNVFTLTDLSLTTGVGFNLSLRSAPTATATNRMSKAFFDFRGSTNASTIIGQDFQWFQYTPLAGHTEYVVDIQNQNNSLASADSTVAALLRLDNADTTASSSIVVTDALRIENTGNISGGITNAINIADSDITNDIVLQNGEIINNESDGTIAFTDGTNTLLEIKALSTNFGAYLETGASIDKNSYFGEEFNFARGALSADTAGGGIETSFGDSGMWGTYEQAVTECEFANTADIVGGIARLTANAASNECALIVDDAINNARLIIAPANLPVIIMKVRPSQADATSYSYVGIADSTDALATAPTNFIGFSNNGGTGWVGMTISNEAGGGTSTVTCSGSTISTAQFALLKIEVTSNSNVNFYVDDDVSNGISWISCGSATTENNIPDAALAPEIHWQERAGGASSYLDTDFIRIWQDDSVATPDPFPAQTGPVPADFEGKSALTQVYPADDLNLEPGTLVSLDTTANDVKVKTSDKAYDHLLVGIVANNTGLGLDNSTIDGVRVAVGGRTRVKVSTKNGPIAIGDPLTSSSVPGVAMKATKAGPVVGKALESFNGAEDEIDKIMVFVNVSYYLPQDLLDKLNNQKQNTGNITEIASDFTDMVKQVLASLGLLIENGIAQVQKLIAGVIETGNLKVGSPEKPTGISIYDEDTGKPYCIKMKAGQMISTSGECQTVSQPPAEQPSPEQPPVDNPPTEPTPPEATPPSQVSSEQTSSGQPSPEPTPGIGNSSTESQVEQPIVESESVQSSESASDGQAGEINQ